VIVGGISIWFHSKYLQGALLLIPISRLERGFLGDGFVYALRMSRRPKITRGVRDLSVREKAYLHIQQLIATGKLASGSSVSELLLAKELGSSRTPIREAMNQLVAEGLLEQGMNGGMIVSQLKREDIIELYELREALEVYSVGKVASVPLRPADKDRLQYMVDVIPSLKAELEASGQSELGDEQMQRFIACDLGFHALLMSMTNNSRIQKLVNDTRLLIRIFAIHRSGHSAALLESIYGHHQRILNAVARQDRAEAMEAISEHIQASQRERLNEYDQWRREAALRQNMPAFFALQKLTPEI
jgi:DNA-binding GntR family transcriptional regulator